MARVAIVIVTYNSGAQIGGCLDALAGVPDTEVVVVDNASEDNTREEVMARGVRLIANAGNAGFAAAVNQGVRATKAHLVLTLNPDAHLVRGLDAMADCLERPPDGREAGAAGGMLVGEDGRPQTGFMARNLPTPAALIFEILGINRLWPGNPVNWHYRCLGFDPMAVARVEQPAGGFLMFKRTVWERLGGFDERFHPIWFEDVDFCARIGSAGLGCWYHPGAVAKHAGAHSITALALEKRERYWYGSLLKYAALHFSSIFFGATCAAVVTGAVFRGVLGFPRYRFRAVMIYGGIARLAFGRALRRTVGQAE